MNDIKLCEILSRELEGVNGFLDIGCGDGFLVCCLARRLNKKIVGLDIAIKGFTRARKYCKRFDVCNLIECTKGDAHDMRMFKNNEFDAVASIYSLHHMSDPKVVLREAKRVLKPDGKIVAIEYVVKKRRSKCHKFVKEEINKLMENAGFKETTTQDLEDDIILVTSRK